MEGAVSVDLRSVARDEISTAANLVRDFYAIEGIVSDDATVRRVLEEIVDDPLLGRVWFVTVDGAIAGYIVLTFGYSLEYRGRDAFIDELFLAADYRGRGVGTAVIGLVASAARALRVHAVHLEVDQHNHHAQALYRKTGFGGPERYLLTRWLDDDAKS